MNANQKMRGEEIVAALRALDVEGERVSQAQGELIATMFEGSFSLFQELDERPGQFDVSYASDDWHWKLRQARNGCDAFFHLLNERSKTVREVQRKLAEIKVDCGYHELDGGPVEGLIAYKEALEDQFGILWPRARAWDAIDEALDRNAAGERHASAADVCAVGFARQEAIRNG